MAQQRMRTHTEYDYERLLELQRVLGRALTHRRRTRQRMINIGLGAAAIAMAVGLAVMGKNVLFVALLAGLGLYFIVWGLFFFQFAALATLRSLKPSQAETDCFLERTYMLVTNGNVNDGQQYRYEDCLRLFETEGSFCFILKDGQGVVLDKANLKGGSVDQLRAWLEEKSGKKAEWMGKGSGPSRLDQGA